MTRVKDISGTVHFRNPAHAGFTLCAKTAGADLLGNISPVGKETSEYVNCPRCAKVYCAVKNEPWNTCIHEPFAPGVLEQGIFDAVKEDGTCQEDV